MLNYMNKIANHLQDLTELRDYDRIAEVLSFLYDNQTNPPSLAETAQHAGLSEFHFQRLFRRWAGISPKQFCQYLTLHQSRERLLDSKSLLETSIETGLSGSGRLHDCYVSIVAMTPAEYRDGGAGIQIRYGIGATLFGTALIASTGRGVCMLEFLDETNDDASATAQRARSMVETAWPAATLVEDQQRAGNLLQRIFNNGNMDNGKGVILHTRGTNFQIRVWEALLQLPVGYSVNYETLAAFLNIDSGARAVASAVAKNPVAYLVPCHRVIRKTGVIGRYRWGSARKHAILGYEGTRSLARSN